MATRKAICKKFYIGADGAQTTQCPDDAIGVGFNLIDQDAPKDVDGNYSYSETITMMAEDVPEVNHLKGMLMGWLQKIGDAYAGKGAEAAEIIHTMIERICEGEWVEKGAGVGPRPSMLLDAIMNVIVAQGGNDTEENRAGVKASISSTEGKDAAMNEPVIKAAYTQLQVEAAQKRADAAAAKAGTGTASLAFLGLGGNAADADANEDAVTEENTAPDEQHHEA